MIPLVSRFDLLHRRLILQFEFAVQLEVLMGAIPKCGHVALVLVCCYGDMYVILSSSGSL